LHRPVSPLLHDYKPAPTKSSAKSKALQWFGVGLGIPLLGLALISFVDLSTDTSPTPTTPAMSASDGTGISTPPALVAKPAIYTGEPLVWALEPEYETLTLTIRSGDTLDQLFRKYDLDIGQLATIARLDEASQRFRKIKPGDVFEITHDEGQVVSMYSELNLTSALQVDRQEAGYTAKVVERPIEKRKRHAYGVIESSLYESAAAAGLSDRVIMNIAGIFAWDIDFVLDIRSGDNYYVQYEEIWQDGEFVMDGEIVVAEFNNNGRSSQAIRFIDDSDRSDYFTPDGHSVSPRAENSAPAPGSRLCGTTRHTDQGCRGWQSDISRCEIGLWQRRHTAAWWQHHNTVCTHVEFRSESAVRYASTTGPDNRLRWQDRACDWRSPAL